MISGLYIFTRTWFMLSNACAEIYLLANICNDCAGQSSAHLKYDLSLNILAIWYQ